jgi:hypothetical protein
VAATEFFFALEFSSQGVSAALLAELASRVLTHLGSSPDAVPELRSALDQAVAAAGSVAGERRCDVQFRAREGTLDILVSSNGGRIWQTSRPIA